MINKVFVMSILVILCLTAVPATAQLADTPWPKFHHDLKNTGLSPYTGPDTPMLKWNYTTGDRIYYSSPAIAADGTIYIGSKDGKLYAINPDGTLKWTYTTGGYGYSSPAIAADGTIYIGSKDGKLYAINPDGTLKWNYTTGGGTHYTSPAIATDGTIYIGSYDKNLYAINPDGTLKWTYTAGNYFYACTPAIADDGTIYIGSKDYKLYAINPDGTLKWTYTAGAEVGYISSPAIAADGTVYIGSKDKNLYAINPDGTLKWNYTAGDYVTSSPAIGSYGTIYVGSGDNKLYAINPDGTLKWTYITGDRIYGSSPAIDGDGTIYIGSKDKNLYAINPDGTLKWNYTAGDGIDYPSPAIGSDGVIYVAANDGTLYALGQGQAPPAQPDLIPTAVWDNQGKGGFLFANQTNDITARINNTGSGDAGAFNVTLDIDSYTEKKTVSSLAAGANINVTFTGYAPTTPGSKPVNVTADKENAVAESNEANNLLSTSRQVYYNGYKGKRWTNGSDIVTVETYSLKGNIVYSIGSSYYQGSNWKTYTASWSASDIPLPSLAAVQSAKLYVYYNWDSTGGALWGDNTTFNGVTYPRAGASHYSDMKMWGSYADRAYGTLVYNVTANFNKSGNTVSLGDGIANRSVSIDGTILQVVYSDSSEPLRKIWINEGFDLLMADITKGTDTNETIAYAPFTGTIEPANISSARLIAVGPGAGDSTGNKSKVIFNSNSHWDALPPYKGATQIGIADINVLSELGTSNTAAIQDNGDSGGMRASTTILAIEYKPAPVPTPKPANASVSLGASIRPAIAIEVTPSSLNFGELAPGQTSDGNTLNVTNKGGYSINVTAEVTDVAENLFVDGVLLNENLWKYYSVIIPRSGSDKPVAKLHVPDDYAGVGGMEGTMMFWAEAE